MSFFTLKGFLHCINSADMYDEKCDQEAMITMTVDGGRGILLLEVNPFCSFFFIVGLLNFPFQCTYTAIFVLSN